MADRRDQYIGLVLTPTELDQLEQYREVRGWSRSFAVREALRRMTAPRTRATATTRATSRAA